MVLFWRWAIFVDGDLMCNDGPSQYESWLKITTHMTHKNEYFQHLQNTVFLLF